MGLFGFILLLVGGGILIVSGQSLALDPLMAATLAGLIESVLSPVFGPGIGTVIVDILFILTSLGGIGVIIGALIWFAAGSGILATIGRIIVSLSTFGAFFFVAMKIYEAYLYGVFSLPIHNILLYFASLGLGFSSIVIILIGDFIGAGRKKKKEDKVEEETEYA
jgi:hypothetical protein